MGKLNHPPLQSSYDTEETDAIRAYAFCTQDENCQAQADQHLDDCPVEQRLREELGI